MIPMPLILFLCCPYFTLAIQSSENVIVGEYNIPLPQSDYTVPIKVVCADQNLLFIPKFEDESMVLSVNCGQVFATLGTTVEKYAPTLLSQVKYIINLPYVSTTFILLSLSAANTYRANTAPTQEEQEEQLINLKVAVRNQIIEWTKRVGEFANKIQTGTIYLGKLSPSEKQEIDHLVSDYDFLVEQFDAEISLTKKKSEFHKKLIWHVAAPGIVGSFLCIVLPTDPILKTFCAVSLALNAYCLKVDSDLIKFYEAKGKIYQVELNNNSLKAYHNLCMEMKKGSREL